MDPKQIRRLSKAMSKVLRHQPQTFGLVLDRQGWCDVEELIAAFQRKGISLDRPTLQIVIERNDKKRFSFSTDGTRIRANQGHSIDIDLGYETLTPPDLLYHGTATRNLDSIRERGLHKGKRHHVHLSLNEETATRVGGRHGIAVVLTIRAGDMHQDGHLFYCSDNGVWLTDAIPPGYIGFPDEK